MNKATVTRLKFVNGNAKLLGKKTKVFSLPAGWSCPFAKLCLAKVHPVTGLLYTGPLAEFRCFATAPESMFKNTRESRHNNFNLLKGKTVAEIVLLIDNEVKRFSAQYVECRIHGSGDFFKQDYFDAWLKVAEMYPNILFYAYTKALPFWVKRLGSIPSNLRLTASRGGTHDSLIEEYGLVSTKVVFSEKEAKDLGLEIDHNDALARSASKSFAVLLHGTQPPKTEASRAWQLIKTKGKGGYKTDYFAHYKKHENSKRRIKLKTTLAIAA